MTALLEVALALVHHGKAWAIGNFANASVIDALGTAQLITGFGWVII